tara:strand:+ start:50 stop:484 length:435 start_codon:yes stop_codon:yes gene_type:complete
MIKRYECFTGHKHHEATVTDDGPWVSYTDHAEAIARLMHIFVSARERMNGQTIATLRAQVIRRDEEIRDLRHEIESARDAARGENALRLEAERERDTLRAEVERWVKEVAHLKLAADKAERERDDDTSVSADECCFGLDERDDD